MTTDSDVVALLDHGYSDQWPTVQGQPAKTKERLNGVGSTTKANCWPIQPGFDPKQATAPIFVYRNPATWDSPACWNGVKEWKRRQATGAEMNVNGYAQLAYDLDNARRPLRLPWGPNFRGAAGTTDNGVLVDTAADGSTGYEVQGLVQITNIFDVWAINNRMAWWITAGQLVGTGAKVDVVSHRACQLGDWRADGLGYRSPGAPAYGPQGPEWMHDHVLRPAHLAGPWSTYVQLVGFNVNFGPGAVAVDGGWVEHPGTYQPCPQNPMPLGAQPGLMIPCYKRYKLDITDAEIEQWLDSEGATGVLRESKRWYAIGWRDHGARVNMTGCGWPIVTSTGFWVAAEAAAWKARAIDSEATMNQLGHGLFRYGRLVSA